MTCHSSITQHSHAHFNISSRTHKIFIANKSLQCMNFSLAILFVLASRTIFIFFCGDDYVADRNFIPSNDNESSCRNRKFDREKGECESLNKCVKVGESVKG